MSDQLPAVHAANCRGTLVQECGFPDDPADSRSRPAQRSLPGREPAFFFRLPAGSLRFRGVPSSSPAPMGANRRDGVRFDLRHRPGGWTQSSKSAWRRSSATRLATVWIGQHAGLCGDDRSRLARSKGPRFFGSVYIIGGGFACIRQSGLHSRRALLQENIRWLWISALCKTSVNRSIRRAHSRPMG